MALSQRKLENSAGTTTPVTPTNKALIDAATVSLGGTGTQQLTPTGHELSVPSTGVANVARWACPGGTSDQMAWDLLVQYTGAGTGGAFTATGVLLNGMSTTSATSGVYPWKGRFPASGNMAWQDYANATIPLTSGAHAPTPGNDYRYSIVADRSTGTITIKAYSLANTLLATWSKTGANLGADPFYGFEAAAPGNQAGTTKVHRLQMDNGRTTEIGPYIDQPNQAPTATYDSVRTSVAAGGTGTATLTGTDTDGTIASYQHSLSTVSMAGAVLSGATSPTATVGVPNTPGQLYVLQGRVVDDSGAPSGYVTKELCVPTPDVTVFPILTGGGFVRNGVQNTDAATVTSVADSDYMETPAVLSSTPQTFSIRFAPMVTRNGVLSNPVRLSRSGSGGHAVVRLMQGTNVIATSAQLTLTDTPTDYNIPLTSTQVDAITAAVSAGAWLTIRNEVDFTS